MSKSLLTRNKSGREGELDDLQKKFRDLESKFKTKHTSGSHPESTIRMQRQQIEKLKKDNDRLKEDLALETRQAKQANDMSSSAQIAKLQDQADYYRRKNAQEKKKIEELDRQIAAIHENRKAKIEQKREEEKKQTTKKAADKSIHQEIRRLENKLDNALVKFNEALAGNKKLRSQIDNLRRDRKNFTDIYNRLHKELAVKQKLMASIIVQANAAASAREEAQAQMIALKAQADKEQQQFEENWSNLGKLIEKDRNAKDELLDGTMTRGLDLGEEDPASQEKNLKKRVIKGTTHIMRDKGSILISMEKVQEYEQAFGKIMNETKINDVDLLVETFINAEDNNFSLFNYVNSLSAQIEKYEDSIKQVNAEIEKYKPAVDEMAKNGRLDADNHRKKLLKELQTELVKTESKSQHYEENYQEAMTAINALKAGIQRVFVKIGCVDTGALGDAGVTESNMMQYLGLIEQRANELLEIYEEQQNVEGGGVSNNASSMDRNDNAEEGEPERPDENASDGNDGDDFAADGDDNGDPNVPVFPQDDEGGFSKSNRGSAR